MTALLQDAEKGPLTVERQCLLRCKAYDAARWRGEKDNRFGLISPEEDWFRDPAEELTDRAARRMAKRQLAKGWKPTRPPAFL